MKMHITNIYGQSGMSTAQLAQHHVTDIAKELGINEIAYYFFNAEADTSAELDKRLDGILSSLAIGDVVFFQTPTWMTINYEETFLKKIKNYLAKIVMVVHDVMPFMWRSVNWYVMPDYIRMYNYADVIVVPSQKMYDYLVSQGLTVKKYIIQEMWDQNIGNLVLEQPTFKKQVFFIGKRLGKN